MLQSCLMLAIETLKNIYSKTRLEDTIFTKISKDIFWIQAYDKFHNKKMTYFIELISVQVAMTLYIKNIYVIFDQ